jgi:glycosyltransferase involved in cell wall biosynthesis
MSEVRQIEHFTGFGLYDKSFIDILKELNDPVPYLRGIVSELGFDRKEIPYQQAKRLHGKTKNDWYKLFDLGMLGITSYTKVAIRLATFIGFLTSFISILFGIVYLILKLLFWNRFSAGMAPIIIAIFFISAIQLFFIGLIGEYILNINLRVINHPLVIEEKRINF